MMRNCAVINIYYNSRTQYSINNNVGQNFDWCDISLRCFGGGVASRSEAVAGSSVPVGSEIGGTRIMLALGSQAADAPSIIEKWC